MRKVAISTIASFTFFFFFISPSIFLFTLWGLSWAFEESVIDYIQITLTILLFYLILLSMPLVISVVWESFKQKHSRRFMFLFFAVIYFLLFALLGATLVYCMFALLTVFIAHKWVVNYKPKIQYILIAIPPFSIVVFAIGLYIWLLF